MERTFILGLLSSGSLCFAGTALSQEKADQLVVQTGAPENQEYEDAVVALFNAANPQYERLSISAVPN